MRRSTLKGLFLAGFAVLALGSCSRQDPNTIRFMYWGDLKEIQIVDGLIAQFKKENPGIVVKNERVAAGGPSYDEKLTTLVAGREEPEVFLVSNYYFEKYAQYQVIKDLTDLAKNSPVLGIKDFYPEILKEFSYDGRLYVIPRDVAPVACVYYNKNAFKEAGLPYPDGRWTWPQDFASISQRLMKVDKNSKEVLRWGYVDDWDLSDVFIYSAGGAYEDDPYHPTRMTLDSPAAMEGIQFRADLINIYGSMPSVASMTGAGSSMGTADMFKQGKVAMFYSGPWQIPNFRDITDFDWDIALPPMNADTHKRAYSGGGSGYAISARAEGKKLENAWKLVEFLTRPSSEKAFAESGLLQPANMRIADSPAFLDGQKPANKKMLLKALKDVYEASKDQTRFREIMASGLNQAIEEVVRGEKKAVDALPPAVKDANQRFF